MAPEIRNLSYEEFTPLWNEYAPAIFDEQYWHLRDNYFHTPEELAINAANAKLMGTPVRINLAAYVDGNFAAWSWGVQENRHTFYMVNSAVLPHYRRQKIYTSLMQEMVKQAAQKGFSRIYSRHIATNNAVIIPKLKAGFVITGMELNEGFGTLVHLLYTPNEKRRKILDLRAGLIRPETLE